MSRKNIYLWKSIAIGGFMRKKCIYVRGFFIIVNLILLSGFDYCLGMNSFENQKKSGQDSLLSVLRNTTDVKV